MLSRISGQANQFDLVLMLGQKGLHWFGKVDAIIIHHERLFARRLSRFWLHSLRENRAKQGIILAGATGPVELARGPMDESGHVLLLVLTGCLDFALLSLLAPTAYATWQEGQIDLIFIVQVNFARLGTPLLAMQARTLLLIRWVRTAHRQHWTLHAIALAVQGATHTAFADFQPGLLFQRHCQQFGCPCRERISQVSGIAFDKFQQFLEELLGDLGWTPYTFLGQDLIQTRSIERMHAASHRIFAPEEQRGDLRDAVAFSRKQDDMASTFQAHMARALIESVNPFLFFNRQWAYIHFAWSTHAQSFPYLAALYSTRFPAVISPVYLA
jgi:hypothetical protein